MNEQILNTIIEKIKKDYINDIAIISIYGSYVRGDAYEKSDIDFYFIPKTDKGNELQTGFILDGIGYDLWPMSWERLESLAEYKGMVSLIADAKVIYHSCDADLGRFAELQKKAKNPSNIDFDGEARKIIESCKQSFFDMVCCSDFSAQKETAIKIIENLIFAVALINKTYTHSGWGKSVDEVSKMDRVPERFSELCNIVICAQTNISIADSTRLLLNNTANLLSKNQVPFDIQNDFSMFYEEAKSLYNKLYNACDKNDTVTALMAGASLQHDMSSMLGIKDYQRIGFPDIVSDFHCDSLQIYKNTVIQHEQCLVSFLHEHDVKINIYDTFDDFRNDFLGNEESL